MSDEDAKAELKALAEQRRHEQEPTNPTDDADDEVTLEDAIHDAYHAIDDGEKPENLTLRDTNLAALFIGLEDTDRLDDFGSTVAGELDQADADEYKRADVLRLLVRLGIAEADESILEDAQAGLDAYRKSTGENLL